MLHCQGRSVLLFESFNVENIRFLITTWQRIKLLSKKPQKNRCFYLVCVFSDFFMPAHIREQLIYDGNSSMPTATEVDNRAVAVHHLRSGPTDDDVRPSGGGKWRQRKFGNQTRSDLRQNCGAINCVHQIGNICTDILLQPELYLDLFNKGERFPGKF